MNVVAIEHLIHSIPWRVVYNDHVSDALHICIAGQKHVTLHLGKEKVWKAHLCFVQTLPDIL